MNLDREQIGKRKILPLILSSHFVNIGAEKLRENDFLRQTFPHLLSAPINFRAMMKTSPFPTQIHLGKLPENPTFIIFGKMIVIKT